MITIDITMIVHIINMVVLIMLMNLVLYRPIRTILLERQKKVQSLTKDIETFERNAKLRLEEFDSKLAEARGKARGEFDTTRSTAQAESSAQLGDVRRQAETVKEKQMGEVEGQVSAARQSLKAEVGTFAALMAEKILGRAISK